MSQTHETPRAGLNAGGKKLYDSSVADLLTIRLTIDDVAALDEHLSNTVYRQLQDVFTEAEPRYWQRRAATFDQVGPRCAEVALACRNKAEFIRMYGPSPEVIQTIREVLHTGRVLSQSSDSDGDGRRTA
mgnify:CR=1 FL=1